MPEDYEIVSYEELTDLKKQIEGLKQNKENISMSDLKKSIDTLNNNLRVMIELFSEAHSLMYSDQKETQVLHGSIQPLMQKIDTLLEQNQTVAKGIITVSDMVKKNIEKTSAQNTQSVGQSNFLRQPSRMPQPTGNIQQPINYPQQPTGADFMQKPDESGEALAFSSSIPPLPNSESVASLNQNINPPPRSGSEKKPLFSFK